jgi:hypothetical protein
MPQLVHSLVLWFLPYLGPDESALRRRDGEDWFEGLMAEQGMTAEEWQTWADPRRMLDFLYSKGSVRKLCLLGCGWWRQAHGHRAAGPVRDIVEVVEQISDGAASQERLRKVLAATKPYSERPGYHGEPIYTGWPLAHWLATTCTHGTASSVFFWIREVWGRAANVGMDDGALAALIREVLGNPFRPATVDPSWLSWNDGTVVKIAQAAYDEHRFEDLPILADALEEAGCDDADILSHCRGPGPHVRGCWVVDLLLGKR